MTKRPTIRTALLGAVAVTALGATVAAPSLLSAYPAQAAQITGQPAPNAPPPSRTSSTASARPSSPSR